MEKIRFTIKGDPRTKKNHGTITKQKRFVQSKAYIAFEESALEQMCELKLPQLKSETPINCTYIFYMETMRRVDALNLCAAIDDILVKYGLIKDDDSDVVVAHDGTRVIKGVGKGNGRVDVLLCPMV